MNDVQPDFTDLSRQNKGRLMMDMVFRMIMHYGFWFAAVRHQMGMDAALDMMDAVVPRGTDITMKRMADILDFELKDGLPEAGADMDEDRLNELLKGLAKTGWSWTASGSRPWKKPGA